MAPMLAVREGNAAVEFYENGFGAKLLWKLEEKEVVAGLSSGGAEFFLAHEAPEWGTRGPSSVGFTTVRVELFVDHPVAVQQQALTAGALQHSPATEDRFDRDGPDPIRRFEGAVIDPFGHMSLVRGVLA